MKKWMFDAIKDGKYITVTVYAMSLKRALERAPQVLELEGYEFVLASVWEIEK